MFIYDANVKHVVSEAEIKQTFLSNWGTGCFVGTRKFSLADM